MASNVFVSVIAALLVAGWSSAEVVEFIPCPVPAENPTWAPNCTVHEVRISPCAEAAAKKPCVIKRGKSAAIEFDFTPNYDSTALNGKAFWTTSLADLPFVGMDSNACLFTSCPVQAGNQQTYAYQLAISKKFPTRTFDVKWRLYNDENIDCCFIAQIKLVK